MRKIFILGIIFFLLFDTLVSLYIFYPSFVTQFFKNSQGVVINVQKGEHSIKLLSDIPSFSAYLINENALRLLIDEISLWEKNRVGFFTEKGLQRGFVTVNSLVIHLTNKQQPLGNIVEEINGKQYISQGYGMKYGVGNGQLDLFLFVDNQLLNDSSIDKLQKRYSSLLLNALFDVSHPLQPEYKDYQQRFVGKDIFIAKLRTIPEKTFILIKK